MSKKYCTWLIERVVEDCNRLVRESGEPIPELKLTISNFQNLGKDVIAHYHREAGIQAPYGGIRNPPMVFCNIIRHKFTNYDQISDTLNALVHNRTITACREHELRIGITQKVKSFVQAVVNSVGCDGCPIDKREVNKANERYTGKKVGDLLVLMRQEDCEGEQHAGTKNMAQVQ
jgi:hypothetical protein